MKVRELYEAIPSFTKVRIYDVDTAHVGDFDPFRDTLPTGIAEQDVLSVDASDRSEIEIVMDGWYFKVN